ncbi:MAG: Asp-tRNA(Asn)/Glu-tRNA(Gln) amidotransferase subunit GatC [Rothia sp. (in: high G+C Gram-positive bacteria)]|nr:Asp-tRNA(Asn)/Glu-tRNA(Gln) amidotransferase subunit GatC [Rothia sp. (in: high G+C Gram-positive bacteria)]
MADITRETVEHLAQLAHITMTDSELESLAAELDVIVASVASVSQAVSEDTPATSHPIPLKNVFRQDRVEQTLSAEQALAAAPDAAEGKFRVPAILVED